MSLNWAIDATARQLALADKKALKTKKIKSPMPSDFKHRVTIGKTTYFTNSDSKYRGLLVKAGLLKPNPADYAQ
jgi:hypothetical protein